MRTIWSIALLCTTFIAIYFVRSSFITSTETICHCSSCSHENPLVELILSFLTHTHRYIRKQNALQMCARYSIQPRNTNVYRIQLVDFISNQLKRFIFRKYIVCAIAQLIWHMAGLARTTLHKFILITFDSIMSISSNEWIVCRLCMLHRHTYYNKCFWNVVKHALRTINAATPFNSLHRSNAFIVVKRRLQQYLYCLRVVCAALRWT